MKNNMENDIREYQGAVNIIKTAILQSQARATKAVNQEQLTLYYGIGRYVSANTRKKNWGKGAIESISNQLRKELPGLRGFSAPSLRKMRIFYEEWMMLERNSFVPTNKLEASPAKMFVPTNKITQINISPSDTNGELSGVNDNSVVATAEFEDDRRDHEEAPIGIILCKNADKDYAGYIMQDFRQPMGVATYKTADEMDPELLKALPPKEELQRVFEESAKLKKKTNE